MKQPTSDPENTRRQQQRDNPYVLAQKMAALGALSGKIAHDLNNVLATIAISSNLLKPHLDNEAYEDLALIQQATQRGKELINHLLVFSRNMPLSPQPTDINALLLEATPHLQHILGPCISIETRLTPQAPVVELDQGPFHQALHHLATNAADAMPGGGIFSMHTAITRLPNHLHPDLTQASTAYAALEIVDTGTGMDQETLQHIFEPFYTTKAKGQAIGMGLSLVYNLIVQSRGVIDVNSTPGQGSRFTIYLPCPAPSPGPG